MDPVEKIVADALDAKGVRYVRDGEADTKALDFYLPDIGLYVEVKQFHTDRIAEQTSRVLNIIVIQGIDAAKAFAGLIAAGPSIPKEPTDAMLAAYLGALEHPCDERRKPWHLLKARKRWAAMVSAALQN